MTKAFSIADEYANKFELFRKFFEENEDLDMNMLQEDHGTLDFKLSLHFYFILISRCHILSSKTVSLSTSTCSSLILSNREKFGIANG